LITAAIAPLFRLYLALTGQFGGSGDLWAYVGTPSALDSLGIGSLIAILMSRESSAHMLRRAMEWIVPVFAFVLVVVLEVIPHGVIHHVFLDTAAAAFFAWVIYTASRGFTGITGKILAAAPLVFIGKISYGIYVFHPYVPAVMSRLARHFGIVLPIEGWIAAISYSSLTVVVATVSWYAFERPINRLKRKFPYPTSASLEAR
jgi:peptidoglycan/LPS O-acetylase OafA/YrhL